MILLVDNYDSFVYNIYQYLGELGSDVLVKRNDKITISDIKSLSPQKIIISPGPCTPRDAGISIEIVTGLGGHIPILGVCLGHQSIGVAYGGRIVKLDKVWHGKTSRIFHNGKYIYEGIPSGFVATRYHSLIIERATCPACLEITSWTEDGVIMGVRHKEYSVEGIQFHPESILTKEGKKILSNFLVRG